MRTGKTKDMTIGNPIRLLLAFSMPLMLGNLFQQLYTFVDALIVGQYVGADALAALGASEWLTFIMFGVISGITQGCSVVAARFFGEKKMDSLKKAIYGGGCIAAFGAVVFTVAGQTLVRRGLELLRTPEEVLGLTEIYLRILYGGVPVTFLYNIAAAILRALGNSQKPLRAMMIASLGNIAFDVLFVVKLDMGIGGAAWGTVLAQVLASAYCITSIREIEICRINKEDRVIDRDILWEQIKIGVPMGIQNIITAAGGLVVQATVNGFGFLFLTGYAAANKLYVLLETAASSYGHGILTYTAQNKGLGSYKRIRGGLVSALLIGVVTALMMSAIMVFAGRGILGLFIRETENGAGEMLQVGCSYLGVLALGFPLLYWLYIIRCCIQGMGDSVIPMLSSFMQVVMRIMCALFLTQVIGHEGVFWGEVLAWAGADLFLAFVLFFRLRGSGDSNTLWQGTN
ncbi:MAG: polysaccharide biosynthesis C-terminal domain-containing protein [Lachnospiraceae bacterium]|nr:polysaccharide biosynthesis C-terminal domain-containing protein [Lachnospiraceae bacterium]